MAVIVNCAESGRSDLDYPGARSLLQAPPKDAKMPTGASGGTHRAVRQDGSLTHHRSCLEPLIQQGVHIRFGFDTPHSTSMRHIAPLERNHSRRKQTIRNAVKTIDTQGNQRRDGMGFTEIVKCQDLEHGRRER